MTIRLAFQDLHKSQTLKSIFPTTIFLCIFINFVTLINQLSAGKSGDLGFKITAQVTVFIKMFRLFRV